VFERDPAAGGAMLHGFAGYFECVLYGDVLLSIHPPTHSKDMFSWFPIFFPLREPVYVPAGARVVAKMWRCVSAHKVWYEWATTAPVAGPIHNVNGRSYYVGL
jgi:protein arginine N-methyltransferase 5